MVVKRRPKQEMMVAAPEDEGEASCEEESGDDLEEGGSEPEEGDAGEGENGEEVDYFMPYKRERPNDRVDIPEMPAPKKQKGWKSVNMAQRFLAEFEGEGGVMIEEADEDEIGIVYADGRAPYLEDDDLRLDGKRKKKKGKAKLKVKGPQTKADTRRKSDTKIPGDKEGQPNEVVQKAQEEEVDLPAWKDFELHPALVKGLAALGFASPTEVQARCLVPAIRQRKDIVGAAETGSGKTLAFGLPILHHCLTSIGWKLEHGAAPQGLPRREGGLPCLVILPTRELAVQVQSHLNTVAKFTPIRVEAVVGGMSVEKQRRVLRKKPAVVVGTPGRLHVLLGLKKSNNDERSDWLHKGFGELRHLILDEADRLVESGHFKELDQILAYLYKNLVRKTQLQTFVFSATLTLDPRSLRQRKRPGADDQGKIGVLMRRLQFREARAVHLVDLTKAEGEEQSERPPDERQFMRLPPALKLREIVCSKEQDREVVLAMWLLRRFRWHSDLEGPAALVCQSVIHHIGAGPRVDKEAEADREKPGGRILLFVNAVSYVQRLTQVLSLLMESPSARNVLQKVKMTQGKNIPGLCVDVISLHGQLKQRDRLKRIERFRKLPHAILVCTDIAARGLDIPEVAAVLHYQVPRAAETFVHRSGRTARAGRRGESVAFMAPDDARQWVKVYRTAGITKDRIHTIDSSAEHLQAAREAVRLASDLEKQVHKIHKEAGEITWMQRTAAEADLMLSEDEEDPDVGRAAAPKRKLGALYAQLQARVRRPPKRAGGGPIPIRARQRKRYHIQRMAGIA